MVVKEKIVNIHSFVSISWS